MDLNKRTTACKITRTVHEEPLGDHVEIHTLDANPEQQTADSMQRRRILQAMDELPADQRQALHLAYFSGLSHSELATRLDQPLGTVKTRIRSGMMKMRELLGEYA